MKNLKSKVIRWLIIFMCIGSAKMSAQKVSLRLVGNSIKVSNDTLYFKLKLYNRDSVPFAFYNLYTTPGIDSDTKRFDNENIVSIIPWLLVSVYDKSGKLPKKIRAQTGSIDTTWSRGLDAYNVIRPNESIDIDCVECLWPINLKKGRYKLQIKYLSNKSYYKEDFLKEKKVKPNLINCKMFIGVLKSNSEMFYYTPPPPGYYQFDN
jgi:hypothetical protein